MWFNLWLELWDRLLKALTDLRSMLYARIQRGYGGGGCEYGPPGKSKVATGFLSNTGTAPLGFKCYSRDLRSSPKYDGDNINTPKNHQHTHTRTHARARNKTQISGPPDGIIWICVCVGDAFRTKQIMRLTFVFSMDSNYLKLHTL